MEITFLIVEKSWNCVFEFLWEPCVNVNFAFSFSRGFIRNLIDFLEIRCCGLFRPNPNDWLHLYDLPGEHVTHKRMPFNVPRDNYQFV